MAYGKTGVLRSVRPSAQATYHIHVRDIDANKKQKSCASLRRTVENYGSYNDRTYNSLALQRNCA